MKYLTRNLKRLLSSFVSLFMLVNIVTFSPIPVLAVSNTGQISGYIFFDKNENGKWEYNNPHEIALNGVSVELYKLVNNVNCKIKTSTSLNGYYSFKGLEVGTYIVKVIPAKGYTFTKEGNGADPKNRSSDVNQQTGTKKVQVSNYNEIVNAGLKEGEFNPDTTEPSFKAIINLTKEVQKNQFLLNDQFTVKYKIQPQPIDAKKILPDFYLKDKEVVLVMDTSGSMAWDVSNGGGSEQNLEYTKDNNENKVYYQKNSYGVEYYRWQYTNNLYNNGWEKIYYNLYNTEREVLYKDKYGNTIKPRILLAKEAAKSFINKLKGNSKVKVSLVSYSSYAEDKKLRNKDFVNLSDESEVNTLVNTIDGLQPSGGTNIGDGLRNAYYKFSSGIENSRKYVILLTDGEPTYHSYIGNNFYMDNGEYGKNYNVGGGKNKATPEDREYVNKVAKELILNGRNKIDSFMIAFTNDADRNELKNIANSANGFYKQAQDGTALDEVYEKLAEQIQSDLPIHGMNFQETFPKGINIVDASEGLEINGQTVTGDIGSISYTLNKQTNQFEAKPFEFSITLKATEIGNYKIGRDGNDNSTSYINYKDIDGTDGHKDFPTLDISVCENKPPQLSANLTNHETNKDKYTISLTIDEPAKTQIFNAEGYQIWAQDKTNESINEYPKTFTIDIDKSDLSESFIMIRAEDKSDNKSEETVPLINLKSIENKQWYQIEKVIKGVLNLETEENSVIVYMKINGNNVAKDRLTDGGKYAQNVNFKYGINIIEVTVKNQFNNTSTLKFNEVINKQPPLVTITTPIMGDNKVNSKEAKGVIISGTTEPNAKVIIEITDGSKTIGTNVPVTVYENGNYIVSAIDISELVDGKITITATATDIAGNMSNTKKYIEKHSSGSIIQHGIFSNKQVKKVDNIKVVKGFNIELGVEFKVYDKNPDVKLILDKNVNKVAYTLYRVATNGSKTIAINKTEILRGNNVDIITIDVPVNSTLFDNHYILAYKIYQNALVNTNLSNNFSLNGCSPSNIGVQVIKKPILK